jgi:pterin-4a-carbinolamine dehydratase
MSEQSTPEGWNRNDRPPNLFRRFQFANYAETRTFLDRLAELSKEIGYYPDISFGTTYANVTVHARDGSAVSAEDVAFAHKANEFARSGMTKE